MLPLRNAMQCLYFKLKDEAKLGKFPADYEPGIQFSGVFGNVDGNMGAFGGFQTKEYSYSLDTNDLKLHSRAMKVDDLIFVGVEYANGAPILSDDCRYRVVGYMIGTTRINFRDQRKNEEEAPKRLYLK